INFDPILDNLNDLSDEQISYLQEKEIIPVEEEPVVEIVEEIIEPAFITDFRQTYYSVEHGEVKVGYGLRYTDDLVKN
ncbi:MAG TPA: hypothetical protein DCY20_04060, partial [Firmicutes bacterium]|nr:hypothetical protein [Bacillota bacterium]